MIPRALPEQHYGTQDDAPQAALPLLRDGIDTILWHTSYGTILIEIRAGVTYVSGSPVEPIAVTLQKQPPWRADNP